MKKLLILAFIILLALSLSGQTVVYGPQVTITWDTQYISTPLVSYTYEVWFDDAAEQMLIMTVDGPPVTLDVPDSVYRVGVRTVRTIAADPASTYSVFLWSDPGGSPGPFLLAAKSDPDAIVQLRYQ
jgi:hypothetical protein